MRLMNKVDWARLTEYDVWKYSFLTDCSLSHVDIPIEAVLCNNINCKNNEHYSDYCRMYERIANCLNNDSKHFIQEKRKHTLSQGGINMYISFI